MVLLRCRMCLILQYVSLGAELYIAPELMYTSLGLPQVIRDLLEGLAEEVKKDCLRHIVITGINTVTPSTYSMAQRALAFL